MATFHINVDQKELVKLVVRLERTRRSAYPAAIRDTLNSLAFDVKQKTLIEETNRDFINRNKNFFKVFSQVQPARGFNVKTMRSVVGMTEAPRGGKPSQAGRNMKPRQVGGSGIDGRTLIPMDTARTSKSNRKGVRKTFRLNELDRRKLYNTRESKGRTPKQQLIKTVLVAAKEAGPGALILHNDTLFSLKKVASGRRQKQLLLDLIPIYSYKDGRKAKVGKTSNFTYRASKRSQKKTPEFWRKQANRQLARIRK